MQTVGSSSYISTPLRAPSAAAFNAALISATLVAFLSFTVRSTSDTLGVGTRTDEPLSLPLSAGSTSPIALAAPVVRRNHRQRRRAGAPQVVVHQVEDALVVGVAVDGGHQPALDAEAVVEHLGDRRQAVGGARGVGDDVVLGRVVVRVVDAEGHGDVRALAGRRDEHLLGAGLQVQLGLLARGEAAGALEHHVHAQLLPGQLGRVLLGRDAVALAVDDDGVLGRGHRARPVAVHRVVLEQVRQAGRLVEVVDGHDLEVVLFALQGRAKHHAPDAAKPVDCHLDRHCRLLTLRRSRVGAEIGRTVGAGVCAVNAQGASVTDLGSATTPADACQQ